MRITHRLSDLQITKNFCLNLFHTHPWECTAQILKACFISIQCLDRLLHKTKFYIKWKEYDLCCGNLRLVNDVFVAHNHLFSQRPFFSRPMFTFCSAVAQTEKTRIFCITALLVQMKVYHFSVHPYLQFMLNAYY